MSKGNRAQLAIGILLILAGVWFVAAQQIPALRFWANLQYVWPVYVIGAGILILIIGLITGEPRMAIPACIVAGVGGILYYQYPRSDWVSWEFLWTLIPGFIGVGNILAGLFGDDPRRNFVRGINLIVFSAVLFLIFAAIFNQLGILGKYGPAAVLIFLGLYIVGRGLVGLYKPSNGG